MANAVCGGSQLFVFITKHFIFTGTQEYTSRTAGLSMMFVIAIVVPLLMILVCVAYRMVQVRNAELKRMAA